MGHEHRCTVCGRVLYRTLSDRQQSAAYCPDRPCLLYPPMTSSKSDDRTLPPLVLALVESAGARPYTLASALGKSGTTVYKMLTDQKKRWSKID